MPIEVGIWRIEGEEVSTVQLLPLPSEERLEDILSNDISILDPNLLLIGRQVPTSFNTHVDLLAMDADGKLIVIELKKDKTPRDVIAQLLDYGSWVRTLEDQDIASIYENYQKLFLKRKPTLSLNETFQEHFKINQMPDSLNDDHELIVVASRLDNSTERIVDYLYDVHGIAINAVYFRFFRDGKNEYLSRVWKIDPREAEEKVIEKRGKEPWNGEYYVSFGEHEHRVWSDARKYGYIAAGGGSWYSKTLDLLEPGSRIWVNIPGRGYVGVGKVLEKAKPITEFMVKDGSGNKKLIYKIIKNAPNPKRIEEKLEYYVRVKWIKTVSNDQAIREKGFFGNQNSVARPKAKRWAHTVERLKKRWDIK